MDLLRKIYGEFYREEMAQVEKRTATGDKG